MCVPRIATPQRHQEGRGAIGRLGVHGDRVTEALQPLLQPGAERRLVIVHRGQGLRELVPARGGGAGIKRCEEVDGGGRTGQDLVRQGAELEPLRHGVGGGHELVRAQGLEQIGRSRKHAAVRAEELVRGADEQVGPESRYVDQMVRGVVDAVDVHQGADPVRAIRDLSNGRLRAEDVRRRGDRDQPGSG